MRILIVDDVMDNVVLLEAILEDAGYGDVLVALSATDAFATLGIDAAAPVVPEVDLILLDIRMPGIDGIEACRRIKAHEATRDIPIIMVTAQIDPTVLDVAFAAGAIDFVSKPFDCVELLARVRCALTLKREMDCRKARERELVEMTRRLADANAALERLSTRDGLTDLANRRRFDEYLTTEWRRALRDGEYLTVLLVDVDHFKRFNDSLGHQAGDECLRHVAEVLKSAASRPGDLAARYGGEEFVLVLTQTDQVGAETVAEAVCNGVASLAIMNPEVPEGILTVSVGSATVIPTADSSPALLVSAADFALYRAKQDGRNCVRVAEEGAYHRVQNAAE
jgi:diguanylate cyclase (GGDEF)-like protein